MAVTGVSGPARDFRLVATAPNLLLDLESRARFCGEIIMLNEAKPSERLEQYGIAKVIREELDSMHTAILALQRPHPPSAGGSVAGGDAKRDPMKLLRSFLEHNESDNQSWSVEAVGNELRPIIAALEAERASGHTADHWHKQCAEVSRALTVEQCAHKETQTDRDGWRAIAEGHAKVITAHNETITQLQRDLAERTAELAAERANQNTTANERDRARNEVNARIVENKELYRQLENAHAKNKTLLDDVDRLEVHVAQLEEQFVEKRTEHEKECEAHGATIARLRDANASRSGAFDTIAQYRKALGVEECESGIAAIEKLRTDRDTARRERDEAKKEAERTNAGRKVWIEKFHAECHEHHKTIADRDRLQAELDSTLRQLGNVDRELITVRGGLEEAKRRLQLSDNALAEQVRNNAALRAQSSEGALREAVTAVRALWNRDNYKSDHAAMLAVCRALDDHPAPTTATETAPVPTGTLVERLTQIRRGSDDTFTRVTLAQAIRALGTETAPVQRDGLGIYQIAVGPDYPRQPEYPTHPGSHYLRIGVAVMTVAEWAALADNAPSTDGEEAGRGECAKGGK